LIRYVVLSAVLASLVVLAVVQGSNAGSDDDGIVSTAPPSSGDNPEAKVARAGLGGSTGLDAPLPEVPVAVKTEEQDTAAKEGEQKANPAMGHLEGTVVLKGEPPTLDPFPGVPANNKDAKFCMNHVKDERLLVSKKGGIRNCVVTITEKTRFRKKPQRRVLVVDNVNCNFVPHISAMSVGSKVKVSSKDPVIHNAQGLLAMNFNSAITRDKPYEHPSTARKPGMCLLRCSFHTWMNARIHILPHEHFDVTDDDGGFRIMNIPPGTYEFEVRHEILAPYLVKKTVKKKLTIKKGETTKVTFELEDPKL